MKLTYTRSGTQHVVRIDNSISVDHMKGDSVEFRIKGYEPEATINDVKCTHEELSQLLDLLDDILRRTPNVHTIGDTPL